RRADADAGGTYCGPPPPGNPATGKACDMANMTERHDNPGPRRDSGIDMVRRTWCPLALSRALHRSGSRRCAALHSAARIRPVVWRETAEIILLGIWRALLGLL